MMFIMLQTNVSNQFGCDSNAKCIIAEILSRYEKKLCYLIAVAESLMMKISVSRCETSEKPSLTKGQIITMQVKILNCFYILSIV